MWVLPVEADGRYDPKIEMRGTGPWRMTKWEPSVGFTFERNQDWHFKTGPTPLQGIYHPIVSEYSQRRAQFLSGNLWSHSIDSVPVVRPEEIVQTKKEQPKLAMYPKTFPVTRRPLFTFGFLPNSPFHDVRIRRAASMVIDRDSWIDAFYGVSQYEKDGLPVDARWDSHYMAGEPPYWIDPKGKGLGEGAAYFAHNVAEATKLIRAAGITGALKTPGFFNAGAGQDQQVQALVGMLNESKIFDVALSGFPTAEWNLKFHLAEGQHEGLAMNQSTGQSGDIDNHISVRYNEGNGQRIFFKKTPSQKMQDLVLAQRKELDEKKRNVILEDLQKEMAVVMPAVPWPGAATGFDLAWPYVENFAAFTARSNQTPMTETWTRFWYNEAKKA
jgi:ABC-type transport system substrate-binding protein